MRVYDENRPRIRQKDSYARSIVEMNADLEKGYEMFLELLGHLRVSVLPNFQPA